MKNCIGKELTKIPMPVNFSEPLSMLQRLTEDFEYSEILDEAAKCKDSAEQLSYVAGFTVSSYATTSVLKQFLRYYNSNNKARLKFLFWFWLYFSTNLVEW